MPPHLEMVAVKTDSRPYPREMLTLLKNILEKNFNKIYHELAFFYGESPQKVKGR